MIMMYISFFIRLYLFHIKFLQTEYFQCENYIEQLHTKNEENNQESISVYNSNLSNRYSYIAAKIDGISIDEIIKLISATLNAYSPLFQNSYFNIYWGVISEENISFGHMMQIFSLFFNNKEKAQRIDLKNQYVSFMYMPTTLVELEKLKNIHIKTKHTFIIIENCLKTEKDIFFVYNIISKIHKIIAYDTFNLNIIFAVNYEHPDQKIHDHKLIDTKILDVAFDTCHIIDGTYSEINMHKNFCRIAKNKNECSIGRSYRYDKTNNKLIYTNDVYCGNNVRHHKWCFNLNSQIKIMFTEYLKNMKEIIINEKINMLESKNIIILETFKKNFLFIFLIQIKKKVNYTQQNIKKYTLLKIISIYYVHKNKQRLYGRYAYAEECDYEDDKSISTSTLVTNILEGRDLFVKFKRQFHILSNYKFSSLSDFLPTKKCFLDYVSYLHWYNSSSEHHIGKYDPKNINTMKIKNLLRAVKNKYSLISKIVLFNAKIIKTDDNINLAYNKNFFNIIEICNKIDKKSFNDEILKNICILIISLKLKDIFGHNSNYYIFLPIVEYNLFCNIFHLNVIFKKYEDDMTKQHFFGQKTDECCLFFTRILKNVIFNLPKKYIENYINFNTLDHIKCDNRLQFYFFINDENKKMFDLFKYINLEIFYKKYKQNLYSELDLMQHKSFPLIRNVFNKCVDYNDLIQISKNMLSDFIKYYKSSLRNHSDNLHYFFHQSNISVPYLNTEDFVKILDTQIA